MKMKSSEALRKSAQAYEDGVITSPFHGLNSLYLRGFISIQQMNRLIEECDAMFEGKTMWQWLFDQGIPQEDLTYGAVGDYEARFFRHWAKQLEAKGD